MNSRILADSGLAAFPQGKSQSPASPSQSPKSLRLKKYLLSAATFAALATAHAADTGVIHGRVLNSDTGRYLDKARVRIQGTDIETLTNEFGEYTIKQAPDGSATLQVFYTGLTQQQAVVSVSKDQSVEKDFSLSAPSTTKEDETVVLGAFVVSASKELSAQALAINEQRFSPNLKTVVSTDAFGEINQGNVGEFVKHMPGVNIETKDGNNPSGIDIRGFGTNYTRVTRDGNSMASAAIANTQTPNRQFVLEGASINSISRIEVTKEPLPDTPANALGGSVNLISKSAFEYAHPLLNFSSYLTGNSYALTTGRRAGITADRRFQLRPSFDATWILPLSKTLGLVVSAADYDQIYISKKNAPVRDFIDSGASLTNPFTKSFTASFAPNEVESTSASVKLDWKPAPGNKLSLSASALAYAQHSASHSMGYNIGGNSSTAATFPVGFASDYTHGATILSTTPAKPASVPSVSMGGSWQARNALTRSVGANYEFTHEEWTVNLASTYSNANNRMRDASKGFFNSVSTKLHAFNTALPGTTGGSLNIDGFNNANMTVGSITAIDANGKSIDTTQLANYDLTQVQSLPASNTDTVTEFRLDVKRSIKLPWCPLTVKSGLFTNRLVRDLKYSQITWTYVGPDGVANSGDESFSGLNLQDQALASTSPGFNLPGIQWVSPWAVNKLMQDHPTWFAQTATNLGDQVKNEATRSPLLMERVSAGYAMADIQFFHNRLQLVGGVRYELTQDKGWGYKQDSSAIYVKDASGNPTKTLLPQLSGTVSGGAEQNSLIYTKRGLYNSRDYHGYYPSASSVLKITDDLLLRGAYAKTMGRPSPSDIVPNLSVSQDTNVTNGYYGTISSSNTTLSPWAAKCYDLSLEYYLPHNGIVSLGVFRKDIENFFISQTTDATAAQMAMAGVPSDQTLWHYVTRVNGGDARVDGLELGFSQNLDFLPGWGRYFNAFANISTLHITGTYASQLDLKNGGGNIPKTGNAGLGFNKGRLAAHLMWNYRGKQFRDTTTVFGSTVAGRENVLSYETIDADVSYQLTKHFTLFVAGRNITNAVTRWSLDPLSDAGVPDWARVESYSTNGAQYSLGIRGQF